MLTPLLIIIGVLILFYGLLFNGLVKARQKVKEAWSGIDVQLKRRYDLIPNLIKTVQGYAAHEKNVLEAVTLARTEAMSASDQSDVEGRAKAENALSGTLKSIFALAENYPDLKANASFVELQQQLTETADQIAASRRIYNGNATVMNTKVESVPSNIVAGFHSFVKAKFFELEASEREAAKQVPKVEF